MVMLMYRWLHCEQGHIGHFLLTGASQSSDDISAQKGVGDPEKANISKRVWNDASLEGTE